MSDYQSRPDSFAKYRIMHSEHLAFRFNEPILVHYEASKRKNDAEDLEQLEQNFYDKRLLDSLQRFKALYNKTNGRFNQLRKFLHSDIEKQILLQLGKREQDLIDIKFYKIFYDKLHNQVSNIILSVDLLGVANSIVQKYKSLQKIYTSKHDDLKQLTIEFYTDTTNTTIEDKIQLFLTSFKFYQHSIQGRSNIDLLLQPNYYVIPKVIYDNRSQLIISRLNFLNLSYSLVTVQPETVQIIMLSDYSYKYVLLYKAKIGDATKLFELYSRAAINTQLHKLAKFLASNGIMQMLLLDYQKRTYKPISLNYLFPAQIVYGLPELIRLSSI